MIIVSCPPPFTTNDTIDSMEGNRPAVLILDAELCNL